MAVDTSNLRIETKNGINEVVHEPGGQGPSEPSRSDYQRHRFNEGMMTVQAGGGQLKAQEQGLMEVKAGGQTGRNFEVTTRSGSPINDPAQMTDNDLVSINGSKTTIAAAKRMGLVTDDMLKESMNQNSALGQSLKGEPSQGDASRTQAPAQQQTKEQEQAGDKGKVLSLETPEISQTLHGIAQKHGRQTTNSVLFKMAGRIANEDGYEGASKVLVELGGYEPHQAQEVARTMHEGYSANFGKLLEKKAGNLDALEDWYGQQSPKFRSHLMQMVAMGMGNQAADELIESYRLKNRY